MFNLLMGIGVGMLVMLTALLAWAICRAGGDADERARQARRYDLEKQKWNDIDLRTDLWG